MSARGELYTTEVYLENRSYFFNVKENRVGDVFLQIVESKNKDGADFERHQIAIFAEDMQKFLQGLNTSLAFIEKNERETKKIRLEKKEEKKKLYKKSNFDDDDADNSLKRTGKVHIVSKRN